MASGTVTLYRIIAAIYCVTIILSPIGVMIFALADIIEKE
jgi:hypothetical protein